MITSEFNGYKLNLVETLEDIEVFKRHLHKEIMVGVDTETSSLIYAPGQIAGVCLSTGEGYSPKTYQGYYFPIRHAFGNNLPVEVVLALTQEVLDNYKTVLWNRPFDFSMLEQDGVKVPFVGHSNDAQIMAHLAFSESYPALKEFAKNLLKVEVLEFSSNNAKNNDFKLTDPKVSYVYAAFDPVITTLLARKLWNDYPYIRKIYPLDNLSGEAVRLMSKSEFWLDYNVIKVELDNEHRHIASLRSQIFAITGYEFKLDSNRDKAEAISRFVSLTKKTKGGNLNS